VVASVAAAVLILSSILITNKLRERRYAPQP
jgi:archaellin